eukprot:5816616-Pleurochrysis_carterae.AAC.1
MHVRVRAFMRGFTELAGLCVYAGRSALFAESVDGRELHASTTPSLDFFPAAELQIVCRRLTLSTGGLQHHIEAPVCSRFAAFAGAWRGEALLDLRLVAARARPPARRL